VPSRKDINKCPICNHPKRVEIEDHIIKHTKSYRQMQADYGPYPALYSIHKKGHMPEKVEAAQAEQEAWGIHDGFNIRKCAQEIYTAAMTSQQEARTKDRYGAVGSILAQANKVLELLNPPKELPSTNINIKLNSPSIDDILTDYYGQEPNKSSDS
jgi:hypothetical protein